MLEVHTEKSVLLTINKIQSSIGQRFISKMCKMINEWNTWVYILPCEAQALALIKR